MAVRIFVTLLKLILVCVTNNLIWSQGHRLQESAWRLYTEVSEDVQKVTVLRTGS